jgi:hypothetical protein
VRHYGLLAPSNREVLQRIRTLLAEHHAHAETGHVQPPQARPSSSDPLRCPYSATGTLVRVARISPCGRSPP